MAWDEQKLGPILDSTSTRFGPCSGPRSFPYATGDLITGTGRGCRLGSACASNYSPNLNQLQGKREMARGNSQTAVDTWLAGIHFAQDVSRNGTVLVALIVRWMILDNLQALRDSARQEN
jgi:hypothetical protein